MRQQVKTKLPNLKECSILLSVVVLFSCMFPWNPKDGLFLIFPNQARISPAVNLLYEPLPQLAVAATAWQTTIFIQVHICKQMN